MNKNIDAIYGTNIINIIKKENKKGMIEESIALR